MSFLHDIRSQSFRTRFVMFALSVTTTVSLVGVLWFDSLEHDMYVLLNSEEEYQTKFLAAKQQVEQPTLLAYVGSGFENLQAAIYGLLNIEGDAEGAGEKDGGKVYLLPLSGER